MTIWAACLAVGVYSLSAEIRAQSGAPGWVLSGEGVNFLKTYQLGTDDWGAANWRDRVVSLNQIERQKVESLIVTDAAQISPAGRVVAARTLAAVGGEASVPLLGKWARERDGACAIRALGDLRIPAADHELARLLSGATDESRVEILNILAEKGSDSAVRLAAGWLKSDARLAAAAFYYLGGIGSDEALAIVSDARPVESLREVRAWALVGGAECAAKAGRLPRALTVFKGLLAENNSEAVRLAAAQGLARADSEKSALVALLKDNNESFRRKLARALVADSAPSAAMLSQSFGEFPEDVQLVLLNNVTDLQLGEQYPELMEAGLQAQSAAVQLAALEAFGVSGDVKYVDTLAAALKDQARAQAAIGALSRLRGNGVAAAILRNASGADVEVRLKWLEVISLRADREALPLMVELVKSPRSEERAAAFSALKNVTGASDLPLLVELQSGAVEKTDKKIWREALLKAAKSSSGDVAAVRLLLPLAEKAAPEEIQTFANALAMVDCPEAADAIRSSLLANSDANRRKEVIRAISGTRNKTSLGLLESAAADGQDATEKILALRGLLDTLVKVDLPLGENLTMYER
ncbi:MAG: hypothetical protein LBD30_08080, partial [Verrucomicrobiales bacterium]|nr:hypothetical protein [Verrucomicrobiales bacterium]